MGIIARSRARTFAGLLLLASCILCNCQSLIGGDLTVLANTRGTEITTAAARRVEESAIFPPSNGFLRRIAWVESKDGIDTNTYRPNYHGGIWQVDLIGFLDTRNVASHPGLQEKFNQIQQFFGIDWQTVEWEDLRKPLYSALAARLFLSNIEEGSEAIPPEAIPPAADVADQAKYWKQYYNKPFGDGTEQQFIDDVNAIPGECNVEGIDIAFVMDGSGSIGMSDFNIAKGFVRDVVNGFTIGPNNTRVAVIQYSSSPRVEFRFDEYTDSTSLLNAISAIRYRNGGTNTGSAINLMRMNLFGANSGARAASLNIPRVGVVLTDGMSSDNVMSPSDEARAANITMFAIGVGGYDEDELNQIANDPDSMHVFFAVTFDVIMNIRNLIRQATCEVSPVLPPNETLQGVLNARMVRYASVPIPPSNDITFTLETMSGPGATCYLSRQIRNPNQAFHEWMLQTTPTKPKDQVYIDFNQYMRQAPPDNMVHATIENESGDSGTLGMPTEFNFVGEEGDNRDPNLSDFPCGPTTACNNGGSCLQIPGATNVCQCRPCFSGQQCEIDTSSCSGRVCLNGGRCIILADLCSLVYCDCAPCFYGQFCENRIDACSNHRCHNGGMCVSQGTCQDYQCVCSGCYAGSLCDIPIPSPCNVSPCNNGGQCQPVGCHSYQCQCINGFTGLNCDIAPITNVNFCNNFPCKNGGTCTSRHMQSGTYICICRSGWSGNDCTIPITPGSGSCGNSPCRNGASCYDSKASINFASNVEYTCVCTAGFTGEHCAQSVATQPLSNECSLNPFPCQNNGVCHNAYFSANRMTLAICSCPVGFVGISCEISYYDPCQSNPCQNGGFCVAFNTYFVCQCTVQFQGVLCNQPVTNPCEPSPCLNGVCYQSSVASSMYWCHCNDGWSGNACETPEIDVTPPTITDCPSSNVVQTIPAGSMNTRISWVPPSPTNPSDVSSTSDRFPGISSFIIEAGAATYLEYAFADSVGNTAVCAFTVSASSRFGPSIIGCPSNVKIDISPNQARAVATWIEPTSSPPAPLIQTSNPGNMFQKGSTLVTYTFGSGIALSVCAFLVEVREVPDICVTRSPCMNNGQCLGSGTNFQCVCTLGFSGRLCEVSQPCDRNPCQNGGSCTSTSNGISCSCLRGYQGGFCETPTVSQPCSPNPCQNGGSCAPTSNGISCSCLTGYQGEFCETPTVSQPCSFNPCLNSGTCVTHQNGIRCMCTPGFTGGICEMPTSAPQVCSPNPCQNGGTCSPLQTGFTCTCSPGFTGGVCQLPTAPQVCSTNPCQNGGTCSPLQTGFTCTCSPGFTGGICQIPSVPQVCSLNPCQNGGTCSPLQTGFTCTCSPGFTGGICQFPTAPQVCSTNPCQNGGTCSPLQTGFTCTCSPGFTGGICQLSTTLTDPCLSSPCNTGVCLNLVGGGYSCICSLPYYGSNCQFSVPTGRKKRDTRYLVEREQYQDE